MSFEMVDQSKNKDTEEVTVTDRTGLTTMHPGEEELPGNMGLQRAKEEDLVTALLEAADFRNDKNLIKEVEIRRGGKFYFSFKIRPVSDEESAHIRRQSIIRKKNKHGKYIPDPEGEIDVPQFKSRLIYIATIEEDRDRIWSNKTVMNKFDLMQPWETVSVLLTAGEKTAVMNQVSEISGMDEDDENDLDNVEDVEEAIDSIEGYAKNL